VSECPGDVKDRSSTKEAGLVLTWGEQVDGEAVPGDHLQVAVFGGPAEVDIVGGDTSSRRRLPAVRT